MRRQGQRYDDGVSDSRGRKPPAEGRSVLISSHLMNEMEATADHVIVIGKGRLIADTSVTELTRRSSQAGVRVVSPEAPKLAVLLEPLGKAAITSGSDEELIISGLAASEIGEIAARNALVLHELSPQRPSLEEAFMELTRDAREFRTDGSGSDDAAVAETLSALTEQESA